MQTPYEKALNNYIQALKDMNQARAIYLREQKRVTEAGQ
jgi:hypothetical protein